jgi:hypothetical protein
MLHVRPDFPFLQKAGPATVARRKQRVAAELKTSFASRYTKEVSPGIKGIKGVEEFKRIRRELTQSQSTREAGLIAVRPTSLTDNQQIRGTMPRRPCVHLDGVSLRAARP